jgi:nucleoside-diphosphate-sugar epimerase
LTSVFVTGGTGFIGSVLTRELVTRGLSVSVLARSNESAAAVRAMGAEPVHGDLLRQGPWQDAARAADFVVHLAQPATFGTRVTLERAEAYRRDRLVMDRHLLAPLDPARTSKVVYVGGTSFYGDLGTSLRDEDATPAPRGWGPFIAPAIHALDDHVRRGLPVVAAFPGAVYGDGSWFREYVWRPLRKDRRIHALWGRSRFASPIHVHDCARATAFLLEKGEVGRRYFLVDNRPVEWSTFYDTAARAMGRQAKLRKIPVWLLRLLIGPVVTDSILSDAVLSNARLRALGFDLTFPTIDQGIPDVVANARPPRRNTAT